MSSLDNFLKFIRMDIEEINDQKTELLKMNVAVEHLVLEIPNATILQMPVRFADRKESKVVRRDIDSSKYVPGNFRCPKCNFHLISNYLNANNGEVAANNTPQMCANECGPMWRVTWQESCYELSQRLERLFYEKVELEKDIARLEERRDAALEYCRPHIDQMWAASVVGKLFGSSFKKAKELLAITSNP